jgi:hypothetical protein
MGKGRWVRAGGEGQLLLQIEGWEGSWKGGGEGEGGMESGVWNLIANRNRFRRDSGG